MSTDSVPAGKSRHRSPLYPSCSLESAIKRAKALLDQIGRHTAPVETVAPVWGYKPTSSGVLQTVSALKQFGQLSDSGNNEDRTVKLTESALDILYGIEGSQERGAAIKAAALRPKIFADIWQEYGGNLPPSDAPITHFLIRKRGFNPAVVGAVVRDFRDSIGFAELDKPDTIPSNELKGETEDDMQDTLERPGTEKPPKGLGANQGGVKDFPLYTAGGKGVLYVPSQLSRRDFELLKRQIDASLAVIEATSVEGDSAESVQK